MAKIKFYVEGCEVPDGQTFVLDACYSKAEAEKSLKDHKAQGFHAVWISKAVYSNR